LKNKFNKFITYISIYAVIILLLISCANIITPSGGPRDTNPPNPVRSTPSNYSTQFNKNIIEINFNEFILLRDLKNQLLISPPLNEMPEINAKGKTLIIEFKEKLKENTTYTLFFGDAIIDLTEGNVLSAYQFVFSTGSTIDSMTVSGRVVDAFTEKPEKDFYVMLYDHTEDSLPYKEKPYYLSKTRENGEYAINNLRNIPYKIFALKDANNNFKFDQSIEKIAFADSLIIPYYKPVFKMDTSLKDSLLKDSLKVKPFDVKLFSIKDLRTFNEVDSTQRLLRAEFVKKGELLFAFRYPVKDLKINTLNKFDYDNWKVEEWNLTKDTLIYWLLKPEIDSLSLTVNDNNQFNDTLNLRLKQKSIKAPLLDTLNVQKKQKNSKSTTPLKIPKIFPKTNLSQTFDFFQKISFSFPNPMLKYDTVSIILIEEEDTINTYAVSMDVVHRKFQVHDELKQGKGYKLILKEDLLTDIFGFNNDSLVFSFKTNTIEEIGNLILNVSIKDSLHTYIIQLLSENEVVLNQRFIDKNTKLRFKNLAPGSYYLKAILDKNRNRKWDTGNYIKNVQAEKVKIYPVKITIRANWDLEENWEL
jgi:hypothetical protein